MKSICIKTNNSHILNYLQEQLNFINIDNILFSKNKFKYYNNIIVHYKGNDDSTFLDDISSILSFLVIYQFEDNILKNLIFHNYFYFSSLERKKILEICYELMEQNSNYLKEKYVILFEIFRKYLTSNKSIIITGFVNFRLKKYTNILEKTVDEAVNTFILEKEYSEFISLLRLYVNTQGFSFEPLHLVYSKEDALLLDKNKNIIDTTSDIFDAKFLSDISFSKNDYILNALLTLLPQKIYIHLVNNYTDEFINTIKLVFEDRIILCTESENILTKND